LIIFLASTGRLAGASVVGGLIAAACGGSPTMPPVVTNTPPVIESLAIGTRAEADVPIQIAATVRDAETSVTQLTYTWSASPAIGTFTGHSVSGSQALIMWRPPKGGKTPDVYTVTLTVSEAYTSAGQARQNVVSSSTTVHYNDSAAEMQTLAYDFLVYKFGNFEVGPSEAVINFSDTCPGKAAEFDDVKANRENFEILGASFTQVTSTPDSSLTTGTVEGRCQFEDIPKSGPNAGRRQFVSGTCHLTTVYHDFRWFLCESRFLGPYNTTVESLRGRVPGRIVFR
jgi:hypothetical protein